MFHIWLPWQQFALSILIGHPSARNMEFSRCIIICYHFGHFVCFVWFTAFVHFPHLHVALHFCFKTINLCLLICIQVLHMDNLMQIIIHFGAYCVWITIYIHLQLFHVYNAVYNATYRNTQSLCSRCLQTVAYFSDNQRPVIQKHLRQSSLNKSTLCVLWLSWCKVFILIFLMNINLSNISSI